MTNVLPFRPRKRQTQIAIEILRSCEARPYTLEDFTADVAKLAPGDRERQRQIAIEILKSVGR